MLLFMAAWSRSNIIVFSVSILVIIGLIIFNTITQGWELNNESVLMSYYTKTEEMKNTTCQPTTIALGTSLYTVPLKNSSQLGSVAMGGFPWMVGAVTQVVNQSGQVGTAELGFQYTGFPLQCNATSSSFDFDFQVQSVKYSICLLCSTEDAHTDNELEKLIVLCTSVDVQNNILPKFTKPFQDRLLKQLFIPSKFYDQIQFPSNTFPFYSYPNYTTLENPRMATNITSRDILGLSVWFSNFSYQPTDQYQDFNASEVHLKPQPQGKLYLNQSTKSTEITEAFLESVRAEYSGFQISATGVGALRPLPINGSVSEVMSNTPDPVPLYLNISLSVLSILMDAAGNDLKNRALGATYLCTVSSRKLKSFLSVLAVVLGNSIGVYTALLTLMIFVARRLDDHLKQRQIQQDSNLTDLPLVNRPDSPNSTDKIS